MVRTSRWIPESRLTTAVALVALATAGLVLGGCSSYTGPGTTSTGTEVAYVTTADNPPPPPPGGMPPEAKGGEAWCRVWVPAETCTVAEKVCVKAACKRKVMIPARYGTRPKVICVQEPQMREKVVGAVWASKKRPVIICPEREEYRRVCCPQSDELNPCEVQCECWTKVVHPAVWGEEDCPICLAPERRCIEYTPAQYKVVPERFLLEPARCEEVCEPAVFETRFSEQCVRPGRWEWRRNESCEVPEPTPLPALQVEMQDSAPSGVEAGTFAVGDTVRYDLVVSSDEGSMPLEGIHVVFTLPPELAFVEGKAEGITIEGGGQSARTDSFDLALGSKITLQLYCKVLSAPPSNLVQLTASVQTADGQELAEEKESTTLKPER